MEVGICAGEVILVFVDCHGVWHVKLVERYGNEVCVDKGVGDEGWLFFDCFVVGFLRGVLGFVMAVFGRVKSV